MAVDQIMGLQNTTFKSQDINLEEVIIVLKERIAKVEREIENIEKTKINNFYGILLSICGISMSL